MLLTHAIGYERSLFFQGSISMKRQLNTLTLFGLMIGPILGSGIILLPPMIYDMVGNLSLWVWLVILVLCLMVLFKRALGGACRHCFVGMARFKIENQTCNILTCKVCVHS
jgi:hypothetical protein